VTQVTLILTLARPDIGVWQSVDMRLTRAGKPVDDEAPKQVQVKASDGTLLIAFTGLAEIGHDRLCDWIRESLRGENRTIEANFRLLVERANRDISRSRHRREPLIIHCAATHGVGTESEPVPGRLYVLHTSNMRKTKTGGISWNGGFEYSAFAVEEPTYFIGGSGESFVGPNERTILHRALTTRPNKPKDYSGLLAKVNRVVGEHTKYVSKWCQSVFMPLEGLPLQGLIHYKPGDPIGSKALVIPMIIFGIDTTEWMTGLSQNLMDTMAAKPRDEAAIANMLEEAAKRGIQQRP
jgi:hypothetical protein